MLAIATTLGGVVVRRVGAETPASEGRAAVLECAAALVRGLDVVIDQPIGVGSAGLIDPSTGRVLSATAGIRDWTGTRIADELSARLSGAPVRVVNDVHAMATGEMLVGAARGARSALIVTVGTGIGGALVTGGELVIGANRAAGHLGHVPSAAAAGRSCPCGKTGHIEAVASAPAMLATYRAEGNDAADLAEVADRARSGEPAATTVLATGGAALGAVLGGVVNAFDPGVLVLGGGVVRAGAPFLDPLRASLTETAIPPLAAVDLRVSSQGDAAVAVGAALHASALVDRDAEKDVVNL